MRDTITSAFAVVALLGIIVFAASFPELRRYMRIRQM